MPTHLSMCQRFSITHPKLCVSLVLSQKTSLGLKSGEEREFWGMRIIFTPCGSGDPGKAKRKFRMFAFKKVFPSLWYSSRDLVKIWTDGHFGKLVGIWKVSGHSTAGSDPSSRLKDLFFQLLGGVLVGSPRSQELPSVQRLHTRSLSWGKPGSNNRSVGGCNGLIPLPQLTVTEALS